MARRRARIMPAPPPWLHAAGDRVRAHVLADLADLNALLGDLAQDGGRTVPEDTQPMLALKLVGAIDRGVNAVVRLTRLVGTDAAPPDTNIDGPNSATSLASEKRDVRTTPTGTDSGNIDVRMAPGPDSVDIDVRMPDDPPARRKRGGQPGNTNRLVHGGRSNRLKIARADIRGRIARSRGLSEIADALASQIEQVWSGTANGPPIPAARSPRSAGHASPPPPRDVPSAPR